MNAQHVPQWMPSFLIPFFTLSYPTSPPAVLDSFPNSSYYEHGRLDFCLIVGFIAVMAVLRDVVRLYLLEPFARWKLTRDLKLRKRAKAALANGNGKANGVPNGTEKSNGVENGQGTATGVANGNAHAAHVNGNGRAVLVGDVSITRKEAKKMHRSVLRFAEQGWSFISYTFVWCFGLYIHSHLPTRVLDPADAWLDFPHIPLAGPLKFYYLLETSFYWHQMLVLNAEARRKDHWQMMTHHVITILLMTGSYFTNYTRIGCLIMMIMDWCDILLPLAKMFRYLSLSTLCDATFITFLVSWAITRHALFILAIKSTWDAQYLIPHIWDLARGGTKEIFQSYIVMLIMLQVIQAMWFWMICRVAYRVVSGKGAQDERSDDEGDGDSAEESKKEQ